MNDCGHIGSYRSPSLPSTLEAVVSADQVPKIIGFF